MSLSTVVDYNVREYKSFRDFLSKSFPKPKFRHEKLIKVPSLTSSPSLVGTAFDYLLRFHLEKKYTTKVYSSTWVAENAIKMFFKNKNSIELRSANELDGLTRDEVRAWFFKTQKVDRAINKKAPIKFKECKEVYNRFLSSKLKNVQQLHNACLFLARLDDIYRQGSRMKEFLVFKEDKVNVDELESLIASCNLDVFKPKTSIILNPTFGIGSTLVGGADADLIVDDTLIDIKVTKHLRLDRTYFNQLLGYYILYLIGGIDGKPNVKITKLGLYFARHDFLWTIEIRSIGDVVLFKKAIKVLRQALKKNPM